MSRRRSAEGRVDRPRRARPVRDGGREVAQRGTEAGEHVAGVGRAGVVPRYAAANTVAPPIMCSSTPRTVNSAHGVGRRGRRAGCRRRRRRAAGRAVELGEGSIAPPLDEGAPASGTEPGGLAVAARGDQPRLIARVVHEHDRRPGTRALSSGERPIAGVGRPLAWGEHPTAFHAARPISRCASDAHRRAATRR